jgi:putative membrane protein
MADDTGAKAKPADTSKTTDTAKPAKLKAEELQVMAHYHEVNKMEIDLGKVAAKKATSQGAKDYAKMLVKDHTENDKALMALAKKTKQTIPAEKPASDVEKQEKAEDKKMAAKLKTMKGADFEAQYLQMMVAGHEKELAKIDANIAKVENAELADALKATKPVLQHHADEAKSLQTNVPTASNTPPPSTDKTAAAKQGSLPTRSTNAPNPPHTGAGVGSAESPKSPHTH